MVLFSGIPTISESYPPNSTSTTQPPPVLNEAESMQSENFNQMKQNESKAEICVSSVEVERSLSSSTVITTTSTSDSRTAIFKNSGENDQVGSKKRRLRQGYKKGIGSMTESYDFWSSLGIGFCNIGALPGVFEASLGIVRLYGGSSMYCTAWPIVGLFICALVAILGEMASTYPVAGAMFTWTFRLCRSSKRLDSSARFTSFTVGSILLCAHILTQIVLAYQLSKQIQETLAFSLYSTAANFSIWRTIFIAWGVLLLSGAFVCSPISRSPWFWKFIGIFSGISFFIMNIILLTQAPRIRGFKELFTTYTNQTGFDSPTYVYLVGAGLTSVASGNEACAHISEDTKNPSRNVPLAMLWSTILSYVFGWFSILVLLSTVDVDNPDPKLYGPVGLLANTVPAAHATTILVLIILMMAFQNIAQLLASSRFMWALARESALPFSGFFVKITPVNRLPVNATLALVAICAPSMLLISVSSKVVGIIILEGAAFTAVLAYFIPVVLYLFCGKDALHADGRSEFSLRAWSRPVAFAVAPAISLLIVSLCLPTGYPINRLTAPYSAAVAFGVVFLSTIAWVLYGNSHYAGPIKGLTLRTLGFSASLPTPSSTDKKTITSVGKSTSAAIGREAQFFQSTMHTLDHSAPPSRMREEEEGEESEWDSEEYTGESSGGVTSVGSRSGVERRC